MKLSSIRIDSARIEGGDWVDKIPGLGDLRVKVRGIDNLDYRRLHATLVDGVGADERDESGRILPKVIDQIMADLILNTILLDWDLMEAEESTAEAPVLEPYTKDAAKLYLTDPDYRTFAEGCAWAAARVAENRGRKREADAGN